MDNEPIARRIIVACIGQLPLLQLAAECANALSAIDYLKKQDNNHLIFLDINAPNLSGLQLLKILHPQQPVIFTTAYGEHAVESYELNAVDYLLKLFSFELFAKAVYKAVDVIRSANKSSVETTDKKRPIVFIKPDGKNYPVFVDDILYCEAMKNYTRVMLKYEQKVPPLVSLSKFETLLTEAGGGFIQIHRSF